MTLVADLGLGWLDPDLLGDSGNALSEIAATYAPSAGLPSLRGAVAEWLAVPVERVLITTGASLALTAAFIALGDGAVLVPRPYYPAYVRLLKLLGRKVSCYMVETSDDLAVTVTAAMVPGVNAIVVNTPHNPVGRVWSNREMVAVAEIARAAGATLVIDETYRGLEYERDCWSGQSLPHQRVLRVGSMSKLFGLPGSRIGYTLGPPDLLAAVEDAHWVVAMSAPAIGQTMAASLVPHAAARIEALRGALAANLELATARLCKKPDLEWVRPQGGIFLWVSLRGDPAESREMTDACLRQGVSVMDGAAFGQLRPSVRCSFAVAPEKVGGAFEAVTRALSGLTMHANP